MRENVLYWARRLGKPAPQVYVFTELPGLMQHERRDPETGQEHIGMSIELFRRVRDQLMLDRGEQLEDYVNVTQVKGRTFTIVLHPGPCRSVLDTSVAPLLRQLTLRPEASRYA